MLGLQLTSALMLGALMTSSMTRLTCAIHPPTFPRSPRSTWPNRPINVPNSITLHCFVNPGDVYQMEWTRNNKLLQPNQNVVLIKPDKNQTLLIRRTRPGDSGVYGCRACNSAGCVQYRQVIKVKGSWRSPPQLTATYPPGGVAKVRMGEDVNISCTFASGDVAPETTMQWLKDGEMVNDTARTQWDVRINVTRGETELDLLLKNVTTDDLGTYICVSQNRYGNSTPPGEVTLQEFKGSPKDKEFYQRVLIISVTIGSAAVLMFVGVIALYCRRRRKYVKLEEGVDWPQPDLKHFQIPQHTIEYDVFISYSNEDLDWVKPVLFQHLYDAGYSVCVDFKDFIPGTCIGENIIDAIYKSKRTVIVMSQRFLESLWAQFELRQAHVRAMAEKEDVIILIKIDDCKLPTKLLGKTFLDWSDEKVKPYFYQRLKDAIGEPKQIDQLPVQVENETTDETRNNQDVNIRDENENNVPIEGSGVQEENDVSEENTPTINNDDNECVDAINEMSQAVEERLAVLLKNKTVGDSLVREEFNEKVPVFRGQLQCGV